MMRSKPACGIALLATALMLPACGSSNHTDTSAVVARVNGVAITADQVKLAMPALPANATSASRDAASKAVLEALVRQEVLAQKAKEAKLDREPEVMRAIESAKRAVLADQWLKKAVGNAPMLSDMDVKEFISHHPEAFSERRQYTFRVAATERSQANVAQIADDVAKLPSFAASLEYFRNRKLNYAVSDQVRTSDQFPPDVLRTIDVLLAGDKIDFPSSDHIEVAQLIGVKPAPIAVESTDPRVDSLVRSQALRERAQSALKSLASTAKIVLLADFKTVPVSSPVPDAAELPARPATTEVEKGLAVGLK